MPLTAVELTARIETEFAAAWVEIKGTPPPPAGPDLQVLFTAVARGVLDYLKVKEGELITQLSGSESGNPRTLTAVDATLGIEERRR